MSDVKALIEEARAKFEAAHTELIRILSVDQRVRMSVPAEPDRDTDLLIVAALDAGRGLAEALEATLPTENEREALIALIRSQVSLGVYQIFGDEMPYETFAKTLGSLILAAGFRRTPPTDEPEPTVGEWVTQLVAERARQVEKGYTLEHDREYGYNHLINWALDYARRGKTVEASAIMLALKDVLDSAVESDQVWEYGRQTGPDSFIAEVNMTGTHPAWSGPRVRRTPARSIPAGPWLPVPDGDEQ